jgi:hypothetical protein
MYMAQSEKAKKNWNSVEQKMFNNYVLELREARKNR